MWHGKGREVLQLESVCVLHWAERWLQVTCCTSVACLVIKRIIISCGVQPKKKTTQCAYVCTPLPPFFSPPLPSCCTSTPTCHVCIFACIFIMNARKRDATRSRQKGFRRPKGCDDVALGHGLQLRPSPPPTLPLSLPEGSREKQAVECIKWSRRVSLPGGIANTNKKAFSFFLSAIRKYENSFCRRRRWGRATMASATTYGLTTWTNCSMWRRRRRINEIEADEKLFQPKCIKML